MPTRSPFTTLLCALRALLAVTALASASVTTFAQSGITEVLWLGQAATRIM